MNRAGTPPIHFSQVADFFAAIAALSEGGFKAEFDRLTDLNADVEQKLGIVKTVEDAKAAREAADSYATSTIEGAEAVKIKAQSMLDAAKEAESDLARRESALKSNQRALDDESLHYNQDIQKLANDRAELASKAAAVEGREKAAAERAAALDAREAELSAKAKIINERAESLKV